MFAVFHSTLLLNSDVSTLAYQLEETPASNQLKAWTPWIFVKAAPRFELG
jgi:hypothetical protein